MGRPLDNLNGKRFGRLVVIDGPDRAPDGNIAWQCACDCGERKTVAASSLRGGRTKSCGCLDRAARLARNTTHGRSRTSEHEVWKAMRRRCNSPTDRAYPYYGGRGIAVCDRWNSFTNFLSDMGKRPSAKHSIDRIDNSRGYEPSNCRWSTQSQQMRNTRRTHFVELNGVRMSLTECAERLGMSRSGLARTLARSA